MPDTNPVRIDKFLWAVRLYKTRSLAINACRMGRVLINGNQVKSSKTIEGNEILTIRKPPVTYTYKVISPVEKRVTARLVINFLEDNTSENEKIKLEIRQTGSIGHRKRGSGRPTKKERRIIDKWRVGSDDH